LRADDLKIVCLGRPELDLTDWTSVEGAIKQHQPDIVVNAAAYTAVDKANSEPEAAFAVNRDGARNVARSTAWMGVPIIHISTDYVFEGSQEAPYKESDPTCPTSVYGQSKLEGEHAVICENPAHVILRTSWVYSPWGNNFARTMLRLAADRDVVRVVADQFGTPTYAPAIADGILTVARHVLMSPGGKAWRGIFHMTSEGGTSWAGFAIALFEASACHGGPTANVVPIATAEYPTPTRRPLNSRLSTTRFTQQFAHSLGDWREGVRAFATAVYGL